MGCAHSGYGEAGGGEDLPPQTVLLIGADGSGKGTFFKQMRRILGRFDDAERREHARLVHRLMVRHMRQAVARAESKDAIRPAVDASAHHVADKVSESVLIDSRGADHMAVLWDDPFFKHAILQADPSMSHLFDKLDDVTRSGYLPTDLDLVHVGAATQGFTVRERRAYVPAVHRHVMRLIKAHVSAAYDRIPDELRQRADLVLDVLGEDHPINQEIGVHIRSLWRNRAVRSSVAGGNAAAFLDRVREIARPGWVPTDEDVLVVDDRSIDPDEATLTDPSSLVQWRFRTAESERDCGKAAGVVLLVDASAYEPDEGGSSPLLRSIAEFERLLGEPTLDTTPLFLVLTKTDLLALRLARVPLTVCFPEYTERVDGIVSTTPGESALAYIMDRFQEKEAAMKLVSHHTIVATDTDDAAGVWRSIQDVVTRVQRHKQRF